MKPQTAQWLAENAPWAGWALIAICILGWFCWLATEGRGLFKYGPRYWRVMHKLDRSRFRKEQKT